MEDKGEEYTIINGTEQVGSLWFDEADYIQLKVYSYVVISIERWDVKEDSQKAYYLLIIWEKVRSG